MKGAVLNKGQEYYTYMKKVFESIGNVQKNYNWLITSCECYPQNPIYFDILSREYCWITGNELTQMVMDEDFQWIWGVLSGFPSYISFGEVIKYGINTLNMEGFWSPTPTMFHPLAEIEIVPWDSTLTLILSKNNEIVDNFMNYFKVAEDLETYNKRFIV